MTEKETEMHKMTLNGDNWLMRIEGEQDIYGVNGRDIPAVIPGSVYGNLPQQELMPDPYEGMNELDALKLMENRFQFQTVFSLTKEQTAGDFCLLRFDGIDTLADIYLNDIFLGHADNMHRVWEFDIRETAVEGENALRVEIASPTRYIEEENKKIFAGGSWDAMLGFPICARPIVCSAGTGGRDCLTQDCFVRCRCCPAKSKAGTGLHNTKLERTGEGEHSCIRREWNG